MAILGWMVCVVVMLYVSAAYVLVFLNGMGKYNIGGVPNKAMNKVGIVIGGFVIGFLWMQVYLSAPFSVIVK